MKKILLGLLITAMCAVSMFAFDLGDFPKGTWIDSNWNGAWTFGVDGTIKLSDAKSGEVIYNFTQDKITDFKVSPSLSGLTISFKCEETERTYSFTKPAALDTSIELKIDCAWVPGGYTVKMDMKK